MDLFSFDPATIMSFILTLFRISIMLFLLPFFGGQSIPLQIKGAFCIVVTLAIWPHVGFDGNAFPPSGWMLALMLLGEVVLGMVMGLLVRFVFGAIQTGGQLIGFQMGFAMVTVVDPMSGVSEAATAHFLYMISILTFLVLNGHLLLLSSVAESFRIIPPGGMFFSAGLTHTVLGLSTQLFVLAVKIAAPVMAALFLVDLALALVGRAAPQMNVLMLGFPLKISVGFFFLSMVFTLMSLHLQEFIAGMPAMIRNVLQGW